MIEKIAGLAKPMKDFEFLVAGRFVEKESRNGNVLLKPFIPDILPYAKVADILVIPAGHSSLMEAILLERPSLVIPDKNQPEQESNAKRFAELGLGINLQIDNIAKFGSALRCIYDRYERMEQRMKKLSKMARKEWNGARNSAEMLEEFVERINF